MEWRYDGISVNPFEIMFVPMDLVVVENGYTYAKQAAVYDAWLSLQVWLIHADVLPSSAYEAT